MLGRGRKRAGHEVIAKALWAGGQLLEKLRSMKGYIKMDARAASPAKIRSPDLDPVRFRRTRPQRCVCSCWKM